MAADQVVRLVLGRRHLHGVDELGLAALVLALALVADDEVVEAAAELGELVRSPRGEPAAEPPGGHLGREGRVAAGTRHYGADEPQDEAGEDEGEGEGDGHPRAGGAVAGLGRVARAVDHLDVVPGELVAERDERRHEPLRERDRRRPVRAVHTARVHGAGAPGGDEPVQPAALERGDADVVRVVGVAPLLVEREIEPRDRGLDRLPCPARDVGVVRRDVELQRGAQVDEMAARGRVALRLRGRRLEAAGAVGHAGEPVEAEAAHDEHGGDEHTEDEPEARSGRNPAARPDRHVRILRWDHHPLIGRAQ